MKLLLLILFIVFQTFYGSLSWAQQINIRTYSIEDGLVNNDILSIYEDSLGFIWLCTRGGLSRYDGTRFTNYTTDNGLTNDMINDIVEIAPQKFIVAQNSGGPRLLENGRISAFPVSSSIVLNRFYWINNRKLLATVDWQGIMEWRGNNFQPVNPAYRESISVLAVLNDSLWVTTQYNVSVQLMTNHLKPYSLPAVLGTTITYTDSRHRTWLGTTRGLMLLDPVQQRNKPIAFAPLPPAFDLPVLRESWISGFLEDRQGNCWIATWEGLVRVQPNGQTSIFTETEGLPASSINCIWEDRQKNIWIGTSLGLAKYSASNEVKIFTQKHGHSSGGTICILPATPNSLRLFDGISISDLNLLTDSFTQVSPKDIFARGSYKVSPEEILSIGRKGSKLFTNGKDDADRINWPSIDFVCVVRIDSENFVGSAHNKLFIISKGKALEKTALHTACDIRNMALDNTGILWVGTWNNGLYKIKWQRDKEDISLEVTDSLAGKLPDQHIRALFLDKKNELWIGTRYKGVIRLLEPEKGKYEIQHYGTLQGLSSNYARTVNRDKKGNIWVGTMQGLDKLIVSGNQYRIFNFGKINTIYSLVNEIYFLENGYLVAGGYPALALARDLQQDTLPPPVVYITKVETGSKEHNSTADDQPTRLSYHQAQVYFEFCALQLINEEWNEYRYRLLGGHDTAWTKVAGSKSVYFASLKPGNYTFEVKALGFNGQWGQAATHHFIVATPFWQKAWFIFLIIAAIALLLYALYRYRIHQLIRLQKIRNRIATDLHDEIGSNLTNISILSSLSKRNLSQPKQANEFLQRISEEVSSSSQALDDIIWSVNANHDTLEETVARMRRYAAELFDAANISYELYLDPAFEEKKLIMEQRRDIYLLYKEAVNNIFKHANAKQVSIKIAIEHNTLVLDITDDGKGFDTNKESYRHGLQGMKNRVNKWKGEVQIESVENKGTFIHCRFPLVK